MAKQSNKVEYVNELYSKGNQARWMYMNQWLQNYFFYVGNQYIRWTGGEKGHWEVLPAIEGRIQYVCNKIMPAVRMAVGRMIKDRMQQLVIHANNDEKSIDAAKAATRFLDYTWRKTHGDRIRKEVATWAAVCGVGITKYYIDYDKGPKRKDSKMKDGDICVDVISPFEFVVPPTSRHLDELPWAMHARMEPIEAVRRKWKNKDIQPTGEQNEWALYQSPTLDIMHDGSFFGSRSQFDEDLVLVKELWIRPCDEYPKGRVIIVAGDTLVHDEDIPYDPEFWPFNWMAYGDVPFRLWPMSLVENMIDTQKAINNMASTIQENIRYMGNGIILAPMGAVDTDSLVAEPGAIWQYNPGAGAVPQIVAPNPVPAEVFTEKQLLETEIYDLAGTHMLAGGNGLRAAAAIMLVEQQDETAFTPILENVEAWMKRDAEIKLFLAQKGFSTPRKIKVLGEEGQWMVTEFNAADLCGDEDIDIQTKQDFANDKATRFNQILQLINTKDENGQPLIDRHQALQLLDMAGLDGATTDYDLDYNKAKWECEQLREGKEVAVNSYDDHSVHIKVITNYMKRIDFVELPKHIQDLFTMHLQAHEQMMQSQTTQQSAAKGDEMVTGGGPQPQQPGFNQAPPQMGIPQMPNVGGYSPVDALQSSIARTHNLIGTGGQQL
jgi:hypothetical protein